MVGAAGIEPATAGLEIRCSIRLSYAPLLSHRNKIHGCISRTSASRPELTRCFPPPGMGLAQSNPEIFTLYELASSLTMSKKQIDTMCETQT